MGILKIIEKIEHYMSLLINMEQATLAIDNRTRQGGLSELVDPLTTPIEKFKKERDQIAGLRDSFEVLNMELEKQKHYISNFELDPNHLDEDYFYQSEQYARELSGEEIMGIKQLELFCEDLKNGIHQHASTKLAKMSESDRAAYNIVRELKKIKMTNGINSPSLYSFTKKLVHRNVSSKRLGNLILFLIFFLLSRLKKFKKDKYYMQIRAALLLYNLPLEMNRDNQMIITGAALLAHLKDLEFSPFELKRAKSEELEIIKRYYGTVKTIFETEFSFISKILDNYHHGHRHELGIKWVSQGSDLLKLVYDFDKSIKKIKEEPEKAESQLEKLKKKHKFHDDELDFLAINWSKIIPEELISS